MRRKRGRLENAEWKKITSSWTTTIHTLRIKITFSFIYTRIYVYTRIPRVYIYNKKTEINWIFNIEKWLWTLGLGPLLPPGFGCRGYDGYDKTGRRLFIMLDRKGLLPVHLSTVQSNNKFWFIICGVQSTSASIIIIDKPFVILVLRITRMCTSILLTLKTKRKLSRPAVNVRNVVTRRSPPSRNSYI